MSINNKEFKIKDDPFEIKNKFVKKELKILSHKFNIKNLAKLYHDAP